MKIILIIISLLITNFVFALQTSMKKLILSCDLLIILIIGMVDQQLVWLAPEWIKNGMWEEIILLKFFVQTDQCLFELTQTLLKYVYFFNII